MLENEIGGICGVNHIWIMRLAVYVELIMSGK